MSKLTHIDIQGKASMVDVGHKDIVRRSAIAQGFISLASETLALIKNNEIVKGDVLACARIAGIMGGKQCSSLIPLCHPLIIDKISVDFEMQDEGILITASAFCLGKTGIEMEALTAVSVAALTIWDMCKAVDKNMSIKQIKLIEKTRRLSE